MGTAQLRTPRQENLRHVWVRCQWGWEWAVEVLVLMLLVVTAVFLIAVVGVMIIKAREAVASFSSEPGRQR